MRVRAFAIGIVGALAGGCPPGGTGPDLAVPELLNVPQGACNSSMVLAPAAGEMGQWAAARLVPQATPFTVGRIKYVLYGPTGRAGCDPTLPHRVQVYRTTQPTPPATPVVDAEVSVPASPGAADPRLVDVPLPLPVTVNAGESLVVAVEMAGTASAFVCLHMCQDAPTYADRNYWSGAVAAPFAWATLASLAIPYNITIRAYAR